MIFVTVGSLWPFDRLIHAVDMAIEHGAITEPVFAQVGESRITPARMDFARLLDKAEFDRRMRECRFVIAHAGVGAIVTAMDYGKTVLVMPRRCSLGEHVNDHQYDTAIRFGNAGHILVAQDQAELEEGIAKVPAFVPKPRTAHPEAVAQRIAEFIAGL